MNSAGIVRTPAFADLLASAGNPIPERSAQRVLKAADQILTAGRETAHEEAGS